MPNRVMLKVGAGGQVNIFNLSGDTDVVVDVNGWFTDTTSPAGGGGLEVETPPLRIWDTRFPPNPLQGGSTFQVGWGTNAKTTMGAVLNVTVTDTTDSSFLTVWPAGAPRPLASDLNWVAGQTVANLTVVLTNSGGFQVFNQQGLVDVVIDVDGMFSAAVKPFTS